MGHFFDYLMMIVKHSRHPKLCCYCLKINYNERIFLLSLADRAVSSLKMQNARPKYHMRFSTTSTASLAWTATCRYCKWWSWRNRVEIFITNWLYIIHFRCITSKKVSQISLWVQSGINPSLMPTQILGSKPTLFDWWQTYLSIDYHKYIFYPTLGSKVVQGLLWCLQGNQITLITLNESIGYCKMS